MTSFNQNNLLQDKLVVVTRPEIENSIFKKQLEAYGAHVYLFPTITIQAVEHVTPLQNLAAFDWIIFTSVTGVDYFINSLQQYNIDYQTLTHKKIAAVGPKTAQRIQKYGFPVTFIPSKFTTEQLAKELTNIHNQKILLARSNISSETLIYNLQKKGAILTDLQIYKTIFFEKYDKVFDTLAKANKIHYITFTSPSTVEGFLARIKKSKEKDNMLKIPVISIGPVTSETAHKYKFSNIFTATEYTTNGMIKKLLEIV